MEVASEAGTKLVDTVNLYRSMAQAEYDSLLENQRFVPYDYAMESKWLATTLEDATEWGSKFYPDGVYRIMEVEVEASSLAEAYFVEKLDNIGPAYCYTQELLNQALVSLRGVR